MQSHHLVWKGGPGEDQHGEIQNAGDNACNFHIRCYSAHHHSNAECGKHHQKIRGQKDSHGTGQPHAEEQTSYQIDQYQRKQRVNGVNRNLYCQKQNGLVGVTL